MPSAISSPVRPSRSSSRHDLSAASLARDPQSGTPLPPCSQMTTVFQDALLEEPPRSAAPAADRARYAELVRQAQAACQACPMLATCLYRAVADHDVAGFAGGTTARQRVEIRRRVGADVQPEDFSTLAGVVGGSRQIDHAEVLRMRAAHPDESLETLAGRLGCSLSTVKRHLRQERSTPSVIPVRPRPQLDEVLAVAAELTALRRPRSQAA